MALTFGFDASDPKSYEAMQMRQRLALAMMSGKKGYPKNLGEGLSAIGDSIGDIGMAGRLERMQANADAAAAARAAAVGATPAATTPPPAGSNPAVSAAPATVQTADAGVFPDPATAQASIPAATVAAMDLPPAEGAVNPVQADQMSMLLGGQPAAEAGPPTAANIPADVVSDVPTPGVQRTALPPPDPDIRAKLAQQVMQQRSGVPQQNPMLGGQSPASMPSTFSPADLGSPLEAANNRPIELPIQLAQAGPGRFGAGGPKREVIIDGGIKPPSAPPEAVPPSPAEPRYQTPPQVAPNWQFQTPPQMPEKSPRYLAAEQEKLNPMNSPSDRQRMQDIIDVEEKKRIEAHGQALKAWESKNALTTHEYQQERQRLRDAGRLEVEQQEREQKRQQSNYAERIQRHLGGRDPATIETNLYKSRASVANIPAIVQSLARTNAVVDKMYTGPTADVNTFLSQVLPGFDPARGAATQQFKTAMTDIMAAHRAAVVGPGSQSGPELKLLQQSTAADAKLNVDTIKEALAAAERLMVKTAIAHQQEVRNYAGNFDPDRTRSVFSSFGVPGVIDVVPQRSINKLMQHAGDKDVRNDFDETYHTPGLALQLIQREQLRQQRAR